MPLHHFGHAAVSDEVDRLREKGATVTPFASDETGVWVDVIPAKAKRAAVKDETR